MFCSILPRVMLGLLLCACFARDRWDNATQEYNQKTRALGAAGRGSGKPGRKPAAAAAAAADGSSLTSPRATSGVTHLDTENMIVTRCVTPPSTCGNG